MPLANLPITLAVHGATSSSAMPSAIAMCSMSAFMPGRHCDVITRRRVIASNVTGPTNRAADRVMIATTSWPRFWSPRHTSTALYAPTPPDTPNAISDTSFQLPMSWELSEFFLDLLDLPAKDLALSDGDLLLAGLPRLGSAQQLARPRAGHDDEFKPVVFGISLHSNVPMMASACGRMRCVRARSAATMASSRSTAVSSSSLMTR